MIALGCNYHAPHFGAWYPDACCIDGYLWDLDSGDGGMLDSGGDDPCPWCNTRAFIEWRDHRPSGNARQRRIALRREVAKVRAWAERRSSFPPAYRGITPAGGEG